jgi:hypothetical protein
MPKLAKLIYRSKIINLRKWPLARTMYPSSVNVMGELVVLTAEVFDVLIPEQLAEMREDLTGFPT